MKAQAVVVVAGIAAATGLAFWFFLAHLPSGSAPPSSRAATPDAAATSNPFAPVKLAPGEEHALQEARAEHFEKIRSVQQALALPSAFARREALYAIAGKADPRELDALLAEAEGLTDKADRAAALDVIYLRYVELDPQAALHFARALPDSDLRRERLARVATAWARIDPRAALQQAMLEVDPADRANLATAAVYAWAAQDSAQAFTAVAALPVGSQREQLLRWATRELAREDPQRAAELIPKLGPLDTDTLYAVLAYEWSRRDPRSAAQWIERQPPQRRNMVGGFVAASYAAQYPVEALEWAQRVDSRSRSSGGGLWVQALAGVAEHDPDLALQLALKTTGPQEWAIATVINTIAGRDPQLAMHYLERMPAGQNRSHVAAQIASNWARTDPAAAIAWLSNLGDQSARQNGFNQIGAELAQRDIETAVRLTEQVPTDYRALWITNIANGYVQYDVDAALQWMKKNQGAAGYKEALPQFLWQLAQQDPDAAYEFATQGTEPKERDQTITTVLQAVAMQSPARAAKWVEQISDESLKSSAAAQVASQWASYDLPAARKWVSSLDAGPVRDSALVSLVGSSSGPLEEIEPLIMQIQSVDKRMDSVMGAAARLSTADPAAARDLLRRHPLDPPHQQRLDSILRQQR